MQGNLTIPRRRPTITAPPGTVSMAPESIVQRIPIAYDGDGTLEAIPNNDNVAARMEGNTLVLTALKTGTAQVTVRSNAGTHSRRNYGGGDNKC